MTIVRQNVTIHRSHAARSARYVFTSDQVHKEYVIETTSHAAGEPCAEPVFVRKASGRLCSTGLFTSARVRCDPVRAADVESELAGLEGLEPPSDRGVGLEFEFVARPLLPVAFLGPTEAKILALQRCFFGTTLGAGGVCSRHSQCALSDYCRSDGLCDSRLNCRSAALAKGGECPVALPYWEWIREMSARPLSLAEATLIGVDFGETVGIGVEVRSPGPPHVLSGRTGFKSAHEMLVLLRHVGIQAGPSLGMHVHVNVMNASAPGTRLEPVQVAAVWAAYAKYQLVIDEMLSPGRPGSRYAARLFLGNCPAKDDEKHCGLDPCGCTRRIFNQMHEWLLSAPVAGGTALDFCNAALAMPGSLTPCLEYDHQRYFQLNLSPLHRLGTIEFRAHSATYDPVRVARWVQFVVALVEYHCCGPGFGKMRTYFEGASPDEDYAALARAQREATAAELFGDLAGLVDIRSEEYFGSRAWEAGDPTCQPAHFFSEPTVVHSACAEDDLSDFLCRLRSKVACFMLRWAVRTFARMSRLSRLR